RAIVLAANIHDIGKVIIPAEILSKPSRLSQAQMSIVQSHVAVAHEVLEDIDFPWPIDEIVGQHHERLDGSGYPKGLCGEDIRLEARILGVADVADAMLSHRPYRPAFSLQDTMDELLRLRGYALDAVVVDACLEVLKQEAVAKNGNVS
ncbi:HD domain-containing protein, partial [Candidatus Bipolaricaulota bacterium]|nr:HD domain-containing protein [Candidatus Bipolaricaulota bacterium]